MEIRTCRPTGGREGTSPGWRVKRTVDIVMKHLNMSQLWKGAE